MAKFIVACFALAVIVLSVENSHGFPAVADNLDATEEPGLTPEDCRWDETFLQCGTCPKSCKDPNPPCDTKCKPPMCVCKDDLVRATDGQCIKASECPPQM